MGQAKARAKARQRFRDQGEYEQNFVAKFNALTTSCLAFDEGNRWEAPRIATEICNFCHDGKSTSILSVLELKRHLSFECSKVPDDNRNLIDAFPLVSIRIGSEQAGYLPTLDRSGPNDEIEKLSFRQWWKSPVIRKAFSPRLFLQGILGKEIQEWIVESMLQHGLAKDRLTLQAKIASSKLSPGIMFSREQITKDLRNTEGGHIGKSVPLALDWFNSLENSPWQFLDSKGNVTEMSSTVYSATIRQIGHELLRALQRSQPERLNECTEYLPGNLVSSQSPQRNRQTTTAKVI